VIQVLGARRAEERVGASLRWLQRTCRAQGVAPPRALRPNQRRSFRPVDLPLFRDLLPVEIQWKGEHHALLPLVLVACQVARASEIGALKVADVTIDGEGLTLLIRRSKGGHPAYRSVRLPTELRERTAEFGAYLRARDPNERLIQPLAARSATTDAILRRIRYRLRQVGVRWSPHLTRSIAAMERDRAGLDRADISTGLGHVLVETATTSYVPIDPLAIAVRARQLADRYDTAVATSAIELILGVAARQAAAIRTATAGKLAAIAMWPRADVSANVALTQ
jgi:integrase